MCASVFFFLYSLILFSGGSRVFFCARISCTLLTLAATAAQSPSRERMLLMSCPCACPYPRPPTPVPARQQCRKKEPVCAAFVRLINDNAWKCVKAGPWQRQGGKGKCHQRKKEGKGGRNCAIASHQAAPPAALQFFMQFTDRAIDVFSSLLPSSPPPSPSCCCFLLGVFFFKFSQRFQFRFLFFSFNFFA